jgi:nucleotide-binding universal stress UspA family protein
MKETLQQQQVAAEAECLTIFGSTDLRWSYEVRDGEPADALIRAAAERRAGTIVVAESRHRAIGGLSHDRVVGRLTRRWPGALIVLHPPVPRFCCSDKQS